MRVASLRVKNFKRFSNLEIVQIPEQAKLVLLIGANGSGKSSLFDAFDYVSKSKQGIPESGVPYYRKSEEAESEVSVVFHRGAGVVERRGWSWPHTTLANRFVGRSSIRIVPRISAQARPESVTTDADAPDSYIDFDTRFINDVYVYIQQINQALREPIFKGQQADTLRIFRDFIQPLNDSLLHIFGGDPATSIQIAEFQDASPTAPAQLIFRKGTSKISYDLLSHGEKQVIILLLNFIVRKKAYQGAIIFIDEMDCHLNTSLQYTLLQEIVDKWIPDDAQLWTASHALGFIDFARSNDAACILDLDQHDFDQPVTIVPEPKNRLEVFEIALPKRTIASILKHYRLVVVENKNSELFNLALGESGLLFLPANNSREVFLTVKGDADKWGLRDRDYLKDSEIQAIRGILPGLRVMKWCTFENYLYHPDNLQELGLEGFSREEYVSDLVRQKNQRLLAIVSEIGLARTHYVEFKDAIKNDQNLTPIVEALKSDEVEVFYPFFNMKRFFNKAYLAPWNLSADRLVQTRWFRQSILELLH